MRDPMRSRFKKVEPTISSKDRARRTSVNKQTRRKGPHFLATWRRGSRALRSGRSAVYRCCRERRTPRLEAVPSNRGSEKGSPAALLSPEEAVKSNPIPLSKEPQVKSNRVHKVGPLLGFFLVLVVIAGILAYPFVRE